jgi:hypothetical protein
MLLLTFSEICRHGMQIETELPRIFPAGTPNLFNDLINPHD